MNQLPVNTIPLANTTMVGGGVIASSVTDSDTKLTNLSIVKQMVPIGTIIFAVGNGRDTLPGFLLCNGAAYSRTTYANLFSLIGTVYGTGDGSTTFAVPDMRSRFIEGKESGANDQYVAPGLPNITGTFAAVYNSNDLTGVFGWTGASTWGAPAGKDYPAKMDFDASRSSSIYGASSTVQPLALKLNAFIKF